MKELAVQFPMQIGLLRVDVLKDNQQSRFFHVLKIAAEFIP